PNYSLTEGNDSFDLTDGKKKTGSGFWQEKSTVGWRNVENLHIDIDLGKMVSISRININTARNSSAEVNYPAHAFVYFSNDQKKYIYAGDVMKDPDNTTGGYEVKEFSLLV